MVGLVLILSVVRLGRWMRRNWGKWREGGLKRPSWMRRFRHGERAPQADEVDHAESAAGASERQPLLG